LAASQVGRPEIDATGGLTGGLTGVAAAEASEAGPVPAALVAVTVNVYGVPLARPVTVQERGPSVVQVLPSGELVAV
jgi:hypothetical protein